MNQKELQCLDWSKLCLWVISVHDEELKKKNILIYSLQYLFSIIKLSVIVTRRMEILNNGNDAHILFLRTMVTERKDLDLMWENLVHVLPSKQYDYVYWKNVKSFSIKKLLDWISLFLFISKKHFLSRYNYKEKMLILKYLLLIWDYCDELQKKINPASYNLCVVMYDANMVDNYFCQIFNMVGVKTATLQHGIMLAPRKEVQENIDFKGIEFRASVSDFFLAWNQFTYDEAIKTGVDKSRVKILGNLKGIGVHPVKYIPELEFGVILDGRFEEENNESMILLAERLFSMTGKRYIVRYHPGFIGEEYSALICNGSVCSRNESLFDFLHQISFCIVCNSTVLFELECYRVPFLRYSSNNMKDKYRDYKCPTFTNFEELITLKDKMEEVKIGDSMLISNNYRSFFSLFLHPKT